MFLKHRQGLRGELLNRTLPARGLLLKLGNILFMVLDHEPAESPVELRSSQLLQSVHLPAGLGIISLDGETPSFVAGLIASFLCFEWSSTSIWPNVFIGRCRPC